MDVTSFPFRPLDPEESENARLVLKNLLFLLPEDAQLAFVTADAKTQLIVHFTGYGWHFGVGAGPLGDWQIDTHTEFGQAVLHSPDGKSCPIRTGWQEIPRRDDSEFPTDLGDG